MWNLIRIWKISRFVAGGGKSSKVMEPLLDKVLE